MADIDEIRTPGNWADWLVIVDDPSVIYTAVATAAVSQSDWTITFGSGSGTLSNCLAGMTLLLGSAAGGMDLGIARLRKAPVAGIFYIGIDPSLVIENGTFLTVIDDFDLAAIHTIGVLQDVENVYSDQLSDFVPIPWFDGRIRVVKAGETVDDWDASNSWCPDSTISGYSWVFTGATSTTDCSTATPTATYDTSGRFRVALTVTAANGKSFTGYGYVYVLGDDLAADDGVILPSVEVDSDAGPGFTIQMLSRPTIRDGARVVAFAREWFDGEERSFSLDGVAPNLLTYGRILGETITRNPYTDEVEFVVAGHITEMAKVACLPRGFVDPSYPDDDAEDIPAWAKMTDLTVAKAIHCLAVYGSTLALTCDLYVEDYGWRCPSLSAESYVLYQQLMSFADRAALTIRSDRIGRIYVERDIQLYSVSDRDDLPVAVTLTDGDWQDQLGIERAQLGETSLAEAEGEIFVGGALTQVGGRSPGDQTSRRGEPNSLDGLYVNSLTEVKELAGLLAGAGNRPITRITARLAYNNRLMDVAPRQFVNVVVDDVTYRCIPRSVIFVDREGTGFKYTELTLEPENTEWPSVSIEYPDDEEPPVDPPEDPDPPLPPDVLPDPDESSEADAVVAVAADVRTTDDLDVASPTWSTELS